MGVSSKKMQRLSWVLLPMAGAAVAISSLAFDTLRFDLLQSNNILTNILWVVLSLADGSFAYVLLSLVAGMSSKSIKEAITKSLLSLGCALICYYTLSIGLGLRPSDAVARFLLQAIFWGIAACGLSVTMAPLAYKMSDANCPYRQAAAGVVAALLGAPYWYDLVTVYADGLFYVSLLVCAGLPALFVLYRLRYKGYVQLALSVVLTSIICVMGLLAIYQLSY